MLTSASRLGQYNMNNRLEYKDYNVDKYFAE